MPIMEHVKAFDRYLWQGEHDCTLNFNLLFYGPPGTGKSELARYIAHSLNRELICKRASDLLDPFVGVTEKKIRHTFREAETEEAVLVIDEADSLFFSRDRAHHSWEISFTNEFLAQTERFRGILICTTNRLRDLDHATLRRFNYKVEFKYLTPEGNVIFYQKLLSPLLLTPLDQETKTALKHMATLTPGDFRVVRDRFSCCPVGEVSHRQLLQALQEELRLKHIHLGEKKIGF